MWSNISKRLLKLFGWKITGQYPRHLKKFIVVVMPHTSNWDFPVGLLVRSALKADIKYVAKDSLFRPPWGKLFRWLGGYPVNRDKRSRFVDAVIDLFNQKEAFIITLTPEGTRGKVDKLKTGFYYIALGARVPLVLTRMDWGNKEVHFSEPFYPTGDKDADFRFIVDHFKDVRGKNVGQGVDEEVSW